MALDHALAELNPPGEGVLRLYRWSPHTISLGRNEPAVGRFDVARAEEEGLGFVRRPTGGRAVLHADEVTYCAVLPQDALGGLRAAYVRLNEGLVNGLRALGCRAQVVREGSVLAPDAGPCFQAPAPGEVTLGGRKLVGSAQVRVGHTILQHGSVILSGDQSALTRIGSGGEGGLPPAALFEVVRERSWDVVAQALADGIALALGGGWRQGEVTPPERTRALELERERYATDAWTWRR